MHIYACDAESEPINFTNYTDGQLTPNFTLYEHCMRWWYLQVCRLFIFALEIGDSGLFLCPFSFCFLSLSRLSAVRLIIRILLVLVFIAVYFLSECITLIFCWWAVYVFNASRQRTSTKCLGSARLFFARAFLLSLARIMRKTHRNYHTLTNERVEKRLKKKKPTRNTKNNSFWCRNILYYYQHIFGARWCASPFCPIYIHMQQRCWVCVCVPRLLNR